MMKIKADEIRHVANLARLDLSDSEVEDMTGQLGKILAYVDKLGEVETKDVAPTTHALEVYNAFREDEAADSLPRDVALANGPRQNGEAFVVPKVI